MNGDTFSRKAPRECSKKFAATFKGKFLTRENALRIFFSFLEDFGAPLWKRCRHSSCSDLPERFLLGSSLTSQESREKLARTFRKSSCKRDVFSLTAVIVL